MHIQTMLTSVLCGSLLACGPSTEPSPAAPSPTVQATAPELGSSPPPASSSAASIAAAVAHPGRPQDDRVRDNDRRPAEVMTFLGVEPGMAIADLQTGRGYYAELFARTVGATGKVYAQNNAFVVKRFADKPLADRLARLGFDHLVRIDRELETLGFPEGTLDLVHIGLFYHDTYWQKVDRAAMNRSILSALKPGGIYAIVDHHAEVGSGERDVKTLHRGDAAQIKAEVLAAGFEWVGESELLGHPEDDRKTNVFAPAIRGKTDRFIYKFRKPSK